MKIEQVFSFYHRLNLSTDAEVMSTCHRAVREIITRRPQVLLFSIPQTKNSKLKITSAYYAPLVTEIKESDAISRSIPT
jgi:hypothetical protein